MEKPLGLKDLGGYTVLTYTQEQQKRLNVDEHGNPPQNQMRSSSKPRSSNMQTLESKLNGVPPKSCKIRVAEDSKFDPSDVVESLKDTLGVGVRICIVGGATFASDATEELVATIAKQMCEWFGDSAIFITEGQAGIQNTFAKNCRSGSSDGRIYNLIVRGEKSSVEVGIAVPAGKNVEQRRVVFASVGHIYITIESGLGVARLAKNAYQKGAIVIPLAYAGGAGQFNFPTRALIPPNGVDADKWRALRNSEASPADTASALLSVLSTITEYIIGGAGDDPDENLLGIARSPVGEKMTIKRHVFEMRGRFARMIATADIEVLRGVAMAEQKDRLARDLNDATEFYCVKVDEGGKPPANLEIFFEPEVDMSVAPETIFVPGVELGVLLPKMMMD